MRIQFLSSVKTKVTRNQVGKGTARQRHGETLKGGSGWQGVLASPTCLGLRSIPSYTHWCRRLQPMHWGARVREHNHMWLYEQIEMTSWRAVLHSIHAMPRNHVSHAFACRVSGAFVLWPTSPQLLPVINTVFGPDRQECDCSPGRQSMSAKTLKDIHRQMVFDFESSAWTRSTSAQPVFGNVRQGPSLLAWKRASRAPGTPPGKEKGARRWGPESRLGHPVWGSPPASGRRKSCGPEEGHGRGVSGGTSFPRHQSRREVDT